MVVYKTYPNSRGSFFFFFSPEFFLNRTSRSSSTRETDFPVLWCFRETGGSACFAPNSKKPKTDCANRRFLNQDTRQSNGNNNSSNFNKIYNVTNDNDGSYNSNNFKRCLSLSFFPQVFIPLGF